MWLWARKSIASSAMCAVLLTDEELLNIWRVACTTCCNSIRVWLITAISQLHSVIDKYKLMYYRLLLTQWLMLLVTDWTLIVCAGILLWQLPSRLLQGKQSVILWFFFGVTAVNVLLSPNKTMLHHRTNIFSNCFEWLSLHVSLLQSALVRDNFWVQAFHKVV